jgi:hypothetical protein
MKKQLKNLAKPVGSLAVLVGAGLLVASVRTGEGPSVSPQTTEAAAPPSLAVFISALMDECSGGKHSPAKRLVLSAQLERIANQYLTGGDRYAFVALLCLETRMGTVTNQTSHAGARGIAQLMPATAKAEAVRCGLGELAESDLGNDEINLTVAACHYRKLVDDLGPALAAAAYNSGSASGAVKALQRLTPPHNLETAGYAAAHAFILAKFLSEGNKK